MIAMPARISAVCLSVLLLLVAPSCTYSAGGNQASSGTDVDVITVDVLDPLPGSSLERVLPRMTDSGQFITERRPVSEEQMFGHYYLGSGPTKICLILKSDRALEAWIIGDEDLTQSATGSWRLYSDGPHFYLKLDSPRLIARHTPKQALLVDNGHGRFGLLDAEHGDYPSQLRSHGLALCCAFCWCFPWPMPEEWFSPY
jgi:hypothetical protein